MWSTAVDCLNLPGSDPEVLLNEVEGHSKRHKCNEKGGGHKSNDPNGRETQERGPGERLQR